MLSPPPTPTCRWFGPGLCTMEVRWKRWLPPGEPNYRQTAPEIVFRLPFVPESALISWRHDTGAFCLIPHTLVRTDSPLGPAELSDQYIAMAATLLKVFPALGKLVCVGRHSDLPPDLIVLLAWSGLFDISELFWEDPTF